MSGALRLLRQDRALTAVSLLLDVAFHAGRGGARVLRTNVCETIDTERLFDYTA